MARDSTPDALDAQRRVWRQMGPAGRVRVAVEMSEAARRFALAGERSRRPGVTSADLRRWLLMRLYGVELTSTSGT